MAVPQIFLQVVIITVAPSICPLFCHLRCSLAENNIFFMHLHSKKKGTEKMSVLHRDFLGLLRFRQYYQLGGKIFKNKTTLTSA